MVNDTNQKNPEQDQQKQQTGRTREELNPFKDKSEPEPSRETSEELAEEEQQFKEAQTERD